MLDTGAPRRHDSVGLDGNHARIAILQTPDGNGRLELFGYIHPESIETGPTTSTRPSEVRSVVPGGLRLCLDPEDAGRTVTARLRAGQRDHGIRRAPPAGPAGDDRVAAHLHTTGARVLPLAGAITPVGPDGCGAEGRDERSTADDEADSRHRRADGAAGKGTLRGRRPPVMGMPGTTVPADVTR